MQSMRAVHLFISQESSVRSLVTLLLSVLSISCAPANAGQILSTLSNTSHSAFLLANIDPVTGAYSQIGPGPVHQSTDFIRSTADPVNRILYTVNGVNFFTAVNATTGAQTHVFVPNVDGQSAEIGAFEFNPLTGKIVATLTNSSHSMWIVANIDPVTGVHSQIGPGPVHQNTDFIRSTFDPVNGILYEVNGVNFFTSVDVATGAQAHVFVPNVDGQSAEIGAFEFNPLTGKIVATLTNSSHSMWIVANIDPVTGVYSEIASGPVHQNTDFLRSTFDPVNGILYEVNGVNFFTSVDVATGAQAHVFVPNVDGQSSEIGAFEFLSDQNGPIAVPEPGALALLISSLAGVPLLRRRERLSQAALFGSAARRACSQRPR
jgi:hypothetical protein